MRLLLDTHIALAVMHRQPGRHGQAIRQILDADANAIHVSVATIWEIAIKHRLGKLALQMSLEAVPQYLVSIDYEILAVDERHAVEELRDLPPTNDPFDRMLLAQCQAEGLRLVTVDPSLIGHSLSWRPV